MSTRTRAARPFLQLTGVRIVAPVSFPAERVLFDDLNLRLPAERVALIGRNGVGKSTLLAVLAGEIEPEAGEVTASGAVHVVPQIPVGEMRDGGIEGVSHGELRRRRLIAAERSGAQIVLLDEPTSDLDDGGVAWLCAWIRRFSGCLVVATHDRRLLAEFRHFWIAREAGSRAFEGALSDLDTELEREADAHQSRYVRGLHHLALQEERTAHLTQRRARKKRYGRCSELDRATPKIRLNQKRDHAQVYQGRFSQIRAARLAAVRETTLAMRRALDVRLPLHLTVPVLPPDRGAPLLALHGVSAVVAGRALFGPLDLEMGRERIAIVGPNGAGKTTLVQILLGERAPTLGRAARAAGKVGAIAQGGADWRLEDSLLAYMHDHGAPRSPSELAGHVVAHGFPLALASRPLASLSPGERVRAALLCLYARAPPPEILVLDEPTFSLDLVGQRALTEALRAWTGGLVVASHDRAFLTAIGCERTIELAG